MTVTLWEHCRVSWMCVSTGLVVLNKYLLSNVGFCYPMALSGMGMAFSSVASFIACKVLRIVPTKSAVSLRFYLTRIMPIGLGMSLALLFGNLVYLQLSMSFIQMLKAFSPVVIMVALFIAGQETPTQQLMGAVFAIAAGTALASYGEINLNPLGLACMAAAEVSEATKVVLTQVVLVGQDFHPVEGLMYFAPACCAWLLIGVSVAEWPDMQATHAWTLVASKPFHFALAAVLGLAVNSLTYAVVILASSVTLKVASTIKGAIVVCVGMAFLNEVVTPLQASPQLLCLKCCLHCPCGVLLPCSACIVPAECCCPALPAGCWVLYFHVWIWLVQ
eukprot:jgi/Astpho2/3668/e_gw1.00059.28.1_t